LVRHASRRSYALQPLRRIWNHERTIFTSKESGGVEGLQLLTLADVKALTDVNERRDDGIPGPEFFCDPCSDMGRGDCLRWLIASMPVVLMTGVQDMTEVCRDIRADQRAHVHDAGDGLKSL